MHEQARLMMSGTSLHPLTSGEEALKRAGSEQATTRRALRRAITLYRKARLLGWLGRTWFSILNVDRRLQNLNQLDLTTHVAGWRYEGIQNVRIHQIIGCESGCKEFDRRFYPTPACNRNRWLHMAQTSFLGKPEPPIELIHTPRGYFVQTGEYQISVAKARGEKVMAAYITSLDIKASAPRVRPASKTDERTQDKNIASQLGEPPQFVRSLHSLSNNLSFHGLIRGASPSNASPPDPEPSTPPGGEAILFDYFGIRH